MTIDTASTAPAAAPLARYAAYRRVGDFIFLSGVLPIDPQRGQAILGYTDLPAAARQALGETGEFSVDAKEGPILAQSWYVLSRIQDTIEQAGGSMSDVFKLVQYFRNLDHFPYYNRVRKMFFPGEPVVSTVVGIDSLMPDDRMLIEVEATAYLPLKQR
jgi:2-iminobutanoate/2-iminopropanoate deaminase